MILDSTPWNSTKWETTFNSTHLSCNWENTNMIAVRENNINVIVLKIFFWGFIAFMICSLFCCSLLCANNSHKDFALNQLTTFMDYNLHSCFDTVKLLVNTLHPVSCWRKNPVMSSKKALTLFTLSCVIALVLGIIILDRWKVVDKTSGEYTEFKTQVTLKQYVIVWTISIGLLFELLKGMFISINIQTGMVKLVDESDLSNFEHHEVSEFNKSSLFSNANVQECDVKFLI